MNTHLRTVAMLCAVPGVVLLSSTGKAETYQEKINRVTAVYSNVFLGTINIQGKVVDKEGKAATGVTMCQTVRGLPTVGGSFSINVDEEVELPNGTFHVCYSNVNSVNLRFVKEGCDLATHMYSFGLEDFPEDGDTIVPRVIAVSNLQVQMKVQPVFAGWRTEEGTFRIRMDGRMTVCDVAESPGKKFVEIKSTNYLTRSMIYLSRSTNAVLSLVDGDRGAGNIHVRVAGDGGLVRRDMTADDAKRDGRGWPLGRMDIAPEKGYVDTMLLSPNDVTFAYMCVHKRYGKMFIGTPRVEGNVIECPVMVVVATNGQRNVATQY